MTKLKRWFPGAVGAMLISACHDDGMGAHGCPTEYGDGWRNYGLSLEHTEPSGCPVFIGQPGVELETGATVVDGGMLRDMERTQLVVFDANGAFLNGETVYFGEDVDRRWIAPTDVRYPAGRVDLRPDIADFDLFLRNGSRGPWAEMRISYTDALVASINGPGIVQQSGTYTWSASVATGAPPYTYRWYRNWTLAATGSSYTARAGGDTILLRLDVRDARGEVDSYSRRVLVNQCSDGARVC
jgi:hypothetical protein